MIAIQFTKMHGLGNDFVVVEGPRQMSPDEIADLCDRRFGIGADGVIVVTRGDPIRMEYWNADGSLAEMCGNGLRCVARYAYDGGWSVDRDFVVDTQLGARGVRVLEDGVEVELGHAYLEGSRSIAGAEFELVDLGNPHAITFVDDPAEADVAGIGHALQSEFPGGTNVEFATIRDDVIEMRVWERGVGETLACGTGMAAVAAIAHQRFELANPVTISMRGGVASIDMRDGVAWLRGPAEYSFTGTVEER
ncbi:MAG TPA: diaminopimelate epimerase [Acidimicrobiia bacterium]